MRGEEEAGLGTGEEDGACSLSETDLSLACCLLGAADDLEEVSTRSGKNLRFVGVLLVSGSIVSKQSKGSFDLCCLLFVVALFSSLLNLVIRPAHETLSEGSDIRYYVVL